MDFAGRKFALHLFLKTHVRPHHRAALVRGHQVKNAEEGLGFVMAFAPMRGGAAFVPRMLDDVRIVACVVIGLHVVARVKPARPQQRRKPAHVRRDGKARSHLLRAQRSGITTGNEA